MIKKFKIFEKDKYDFEIEEESKNIISNFDPVVIKYEENEGYFSVLIKDKNSDFKTWLDISFDDGEPNSEWNQISYNNNNSNDMIKKLVEDSEGMLDICSNAAIEKLIKDEKVYDDDDEGYVNYKDYWYIRDGFKERGIDYETAKSIRYDYNL
jgi:hypothetical protein